MKHNIPIYNKTLRVKFFKTAKQCENFYLRKDNVVLDISKYCDGFFFNNEDTDVLEIAFIGKVSAGVIAHEAKHCVNYIFKDRCIKLCVDNDEAECYLLTFIIDLIMKTKKRG